jgi:hypothetical protein
VLEDLYCQRTFDYTDNSSSKGNCEYIG